MVIMGVSCNGETEQTLILCEIGWIFAEDQAAKCLFVVYVPKPGTAAITEETVERFEAIRRDCVVVDREVVERRT
jgi:hypothetical protein